MIILRFICFFIVSLSFVSAQEAPSTGTAALPDETTLVFPDEGSASAQAPGSSVSFTFWDFARMILVLGAVIGCIYGFFYLLRRMSGQKTETSNIIRVLDTRVLSGNRSVHIVRIGNNVFLIGASDASVNLISSITDKETIDEIELNSTNSLQPERKNFADIIQSMFMKNGTKMRAGGIGDDLAITDSAEYIKRQQERLKKFRGS